MAIYQRKQGEEWYVDFRYRDANGKTVRFRRTTGVKNKKKAEKIEKEWRAKFSRLRPVELVVPDQARKTAAFSGFAKYWLDTSIVPKNRRTDIRMKESIIRIHLVPHFSDVELREISEEQIDQLIAKKHQQGKSPKTINNILGCLRTMLTTAKKWGYLESNPMENVRSLKLKQQGFDFYTQEEADQFLAAMKEKEPKWHPFFLCALRTGMRIGELFALRWKDIDFERKMISVQRSFDGKIEGPTKSGKIRHLAMADALCEVLRPLAGKHNVLVFPARGGSYLNRNKIKRPFWRAIEHAQLRTIRIHDLRHSFASQLVMKGVPLKVVQELLGHSDIRMTERYSHLSPGMYHEAVNLLDEKAEGEKSGHIQVTVPITNSPDFPKYLN